MIKSKNDLYEFIREDRIALRRNNIHFYNYFTDTILLFETLLRYAEYRNNCCNRTHNKIINKVINLLYRFVGHRCGFSIPLNVFDRGLSIAHVGTIIVSDRAKIGEWCRIHAGVNIGLSYSDIGPKLGNHVYIAPGAKLFGDIIIADGIAIGANAVVNKSFLTPNISIAGVPAKIINHRGSNDIFFH